MQARCWCGYVWNEYAHGDHRRAGRQRGGRARPRHRPVSGRGYNIDSLTVAPVEEGPPLPHHHRHLGHRDGDRADQRPSWTAWLPVHRVQDRRWKARTSCANWRSSRSTTTGGAAVEGAAPRRCLPRRVVDATSGNFVFEMTGFNADKIDAFCALMRPLGLKVAAGAVAIARGTAHMAA